MVQIRFLASSQRGLVASQAASSSTTPAPVESPPASSVKVTSHETWGTPVPVTVALTSAALPMRPIAPFRALLQKTVKRPRAAFV